MNATTKQTPATGNNGLGVHHEEAGVPARKMKSFVIRFDRLGITENDIDAETDSQILQCWRTELEKELALLKESLLWANKQWFETKSDDNYRHKVRTEKRKRLMAILAQKIQKRMGEVNRFGTVILQNDQEKQRVINNGSVDYHFRQVAKEVLTGKQYTEIIIEAKRRTGVDFNN